MTSYSYRYPSRPHLRKHGPRGYRTAVDFRPWLRDEFLFRCVYCLEREYDNLLYVCQACNLRKGK